MPIMTKPWLLKRLLPLWPPYWGTGIRVASVSEDYREITVAMSLTWYNKNYVGTHFGGSLFAMTDPFYMLMFMKNLGSNYYVWDKAGAIEFIKPGRGEVRAKFQITEEALANVQQATAGGDKYFQDMEIEIFDHQQEIVARVTRKLYFRKKT